MVQTLMEASHPSSRSLRLWDRLSLQRKMFLVNIKLNLQLGSPRLDTDLV